MNTAVLSRRNDWRATGESSVGCDNETVSAYLTYLSQAYLAVVLSNYAPNAKRTSLAEFRWEFPNAKIPVSVVITKDRLDREQDILYVPFWLTR